jgi:ERCC4-related helicase
MNVEHIIFNKLFTYNCESNSEKEIINVLQHCNVLAKSFIYEENSEMATKILFEIMYILNYLYKSIGVLKTLFGDMVKNINKYDSLIEKYHDNFFSTEKLFMSVTKLKNKTIKKQKKYIIEKIEKRFIDLNNDKSHKYLKNINILSNQLNISLNDKIIVNDQNIIASLNKYIDNIPDEVLQHTTSFMSDPVRILVDRENVNVEMIKNYFVNAQEEIYKYAIIVELYKRVSVCQSVIFVNTIRKAEELANNLRKDGHSVGVIHSDLDGIERTEMLQKFRLTQIRTLIATDVISRGIDVQQVGLVINYDVPRGDSEKYIHRVGRSGRFGKKGVAITLITESMYDEKNMESIEKEYNIDFMSLPSIEEINEFLTGTNGYTYKEECCYESEGECNNEESESDNEEK